MSRYGRGEVEKLLRVAHDYVMERSDGALYYDTARYQMAISEALSNWESRDEIMRRMQFEDEQPSEIGHKLRTAGIT